MSSTQATFFKANSNETEDTTNAISDLSLSEGVSASADLNNNSSSSSASANNAGKIEIKILYVDDNRDIKRKVYNNVFPKSIKTLLELKLNVDLSQVNVTFPDLFDGTEVVDAITNKNEKYDFIIMDNKMTALGGIEATQQIRDWEKENKIKPTPIITFTDDEDYKGNDKRYPGSEGKLDKPLKPKTVLESKDVLLLLQQIIIEKNIPLKTASDANVNNNALRKTVG